MRYWFIVNQTAVRCDLLAVVNNFNVQLKLTTEFPFKNYLFSKNHSTVKPTHVSLFSYLCAFPLPFPTSCLLFYSNSTPFHCTLSEQCIIQKIFKKKTTHLLIVMVITTAALDRRRENYIILEGIKNYRVKPASQTIIHLTSSRFLLIPNHGTRSFS